MYNTTTFKNVFQYQMSKFNKEKPQLLLHQPNKSQPNNINALNKQLEQVELNTFFSDTFKIKSQTHHKNRGEGAVTPSRDWARPAWVWASPVEARVSSNLPQGQGLWLQTWEARQVAEDNRRQPTNWRTIITRKFSHCCKSSRAHNRFPSLGIWQKDWESPGNLNMKASGIWLQNFQRTGETDSWMTQ